MSRDDGFKIADVDTGLLYDAKVRKLARRLPGDCELAPAIVVYISTVLSSWAEGRRLTATEAESWIEPTPAMLEALRDVNLLDSENRLPEGAWSRWFGPAQARRLKAIESGRRGGRKSAANRQPSSDPVATVEGPSTRPTDRPDRPTDRPRESHAPEMETTTDGFDRVTQWLAARGLAIDPARSMGVELAKLTDRVGADRIVTAATVAIAAAEREGQPLVDGRQVVTRIQQIVAPLYGAPPKPMSAGDRDRVEGLAQLEEARRHRGLEAVGS